MENMYRLSGLLWASDPARFADQHSVYVDEYDGMAREIMSLDLLAGDDPMRVIKKYFASKGVQASESMVVSVWSFMAFLV